MESQYVVFNVCSNVLSCTGLSQGYYIPPLLLCFHYNNIVMQSHETKPTIFTLRQRVCCQLSSPISLPLELDAALNQLGFQLFIFVIFLFAFMVNRSTVPVALLR